MKNLIGKIILFSYILAVSGTAQALVIDQNTNTGSLQVQYYEPLGQSFYATDANIGSVSLSINPYNQFTNDLTLTMGLYEGAGDFSAGALLISEDFTLTEGFSDYLTLDVSSLSFTAGYDYTIGIFNDTDQWGVNINWGENPYAGGSAWLNGIESAQADLQFQVNPASVPEPSTLLLLGLGMLGLCFTKKKIA